MSWYRYTDLPEYIISSIMWLRFLQMMPPKRLLQSKPATQSLFDINGLILKFLKNYVCIAVSFICCIKLLNAVSELYHFTDFY